MDEKDVYDALTEEEIEYLNAKVDEERDTETPGESDDMVDLELIPDGQSDDIYDIF